MDQIQKFIRKLDPKRGIKTMHIIRRITRGDLVGLDIMKLKDHDDCYRVRTGNIRIKFCRTIYGNIIYDVQFRKENTYDE